jgi:hypothetical protein
MSNGLERTIYQRTGSQISNQGKDTCNDHDHPKNSAAGKPSELPNSLDQRWTADPSCHFVQFDGTAMKKAEFYGASATLTTDNTEDDEGENEIHTEKTSKEGRTE